MKETREAAGWVFGRCGGYADVSFFFSLHVLFNFSLSLLRWGGGLGRRWGGKGGRGEMYEKEGFSDVSVAK